MSQATIQKRFYGTQDLQAICEVSRKTIDNWVDAGKIPPPIKMGNLRKWPISVIERWIDQGCPSVQESES